MSKVGSLSFQMHILASSYLFCSRIYRTIYICILWVLIVSNMVGLYLRVSGKGSYLSVKANGMLIPCLNNFLETQTYANGYILGLILPQKHILKMYFVGSATPLWITEQSDFGERQRKMKKSNEEMVCTFAPPPRLDLSAGKKIMVISLTVLRSRCDFTTPGNA